MLFIDCKDQTSRFSWFMSAYSASFFKVLEHPLAFKTDLTVIAMSSMDALVEGLTPDLLMLILASSSPLILQAKSLLLTTIPMN